MPDLVQGQHERSEAANSKVVSRQRPIDGRPAGSIVLNVEDLDGTFWVRRREGGNWSCGRLVGMEG